MSVEIIKAKTDSAFEEKESFSRLVAVGDWILVSNTAGGNPITKIMPEDAVGQAEQAFANVEAALASVGANLADVVRHRITIPDQKDVGPVMEVVGRKFHHIDPTSTVTCAPLAGDNLRFEIEVTAYRGASKGATRIRIEPK